MRIGWALALVLAVLTLAAPAHAEEDPSYYGGVEDNEAVLGGQQGNGGGNGGNAGNGGAAPVGNTGGGVPVPNRWRQDRYIPACSVNTPEGGPDALCGMAVQSCPSEDEIRFKHYQRWQYRDGRTGDWELQDPATVCRGGDEPAGVVQPEITAEMVVQEARAVAPTSDVHVEPADGTFVNVPTNFYTDDGATNATVHLFGQAIGVRFTPATITWDFGDGATGHGAGIPGAAIGQQGAVEHAYRRGGEYAVTVTRTFSVTFTLPDGETMTVPGEVSSTSPAHTVGVGEIQTVVTSVD